MEEKGRESKVKALKISALLLLAGLAPNASGAVGDGAREAAFAKAHSEIRAGRLDEAEKIFDPYAKTCGKQPDCLEIMFLISNARGKTKAASRILEMLAENSKSPAPYQFELALIKLREGDKTGALTLLESADRAGFNPEATSFLLGVLAYGWSQWDAASSRFQTVLGNDDNSLDPAARFFKGRLLLRENRMAAGLRQLRLAADTEARPGAPPEISALNLQIQKLTADALKDFDRSAWTGGLQARAEYDNNVSFAQNVSPPSTAPNTFKQVLAGAVAFTGSPKSLIQTQASYRLTGNYNFNRETRDFQYLINELDGKFTYGALKAHRFGAKPAALFVLRNEAASETFKSYVNVFGADLFYEYETQASHVWLAELGYQSLKFAIDDELAEDVRRSGPFYGVRGGWRVEAGGGWWNPSALAEYGQFQTAGREFRGQSFKASFANRMYASSSFSLLTELSHALWKFPDASSGARDDGTTALGVRGDYQLSMKLSLLGHLAYTQNQSSRASDYSFTRLTGSAGAQYLF